MSISITNDGAVAKVELKVLLQRVLIEEAPDKSYLRIPLCKALASELIHNLSRLPVTMYRWPDLETDSDIFRASFMIIGEDYYHKLKSESVELRDLKHKLSDLLESKEEKVSENHDIP